MKLLDKILWAINGVLIVLYFISEFVAESAPFRVIVATVVVVYNLGYLVFCALRDNKNNKNGDKYE